MQLEEEYWARYFGISSPCWCSAWSKPFTSTWTLWGNTYVTFPVHINGNVWVEFGDTAIKLRAGPTLVTSFMAPPSKLKHSCESNSLEGCAGCNVERCSYLLCRGQRTGNTYFAGYQL
jgi:hypothetical protein